MAIRKRRTGVVLGEVFEQSYASPTHPDRPERARAVALELERRELLSQLIRTPLRQATIGELTTVHGRDYVSGLAFEEPEARLEAARFAAGSVLEAIDRLFAGEIDNGFAVIRPPGHHAEPNKAMGFCLYNNVALAAKRVLDHHHLRRVAVVDFDVHHGNGTQHIFYNDPRLLFCSVQREEVFPGTGGFDEVGEGEGRGFTVNINLPRGSGDALYSTVWSRIILPLLREYRPEMILVSAGFDAYLHDDVGLMRLTSSGYTELASRLIELAEEVCSGRIFFCLEGGYHTQAVARCTAEVIEVCLGRLSLRARDTKLSEEFNRVFEAVQRCHGERWLAFSSKETIIDELEVTFDEASNPPFLWVGADLMGRPVARAKLKREGDALIVHFLTVHPDQRRRGIARHLVERLKEVTPRLEAHWVKHGARSFWESLGFTRVEKTQDYYWQRP